MNTANRLPGIYFETQPAGLDEALPRMDIAAFVGFACSGPLHTPVPIESLDQFRDIFGGDVVLRWDVLRGTSSHGYLGASIASFFANGGVRCWVVRVAGEAETYQFDISGLLKLKFNSNYDALEASLSVSTQARSAGSWALQWDTQTVIRLRFLNLLELKVNDGVNDSSGWSVTLPSSNKGSIQPGELIKFNLPADEFCYGFVESLDNRGSTLLIKGSHVLAPASASPDISDNEFMLFDAKEKLSFSPSLHISIQRVRFDLLILTNSEENESFRINDLAFNSRHPRFWGQLPTDKTLYAYPQGELQLAPSADLLQLRAEAQDPRFPLAGSDKFQQQGNRKDLEEEFYLPVVNAESIQEKAEIKISDGLENLNEALFLQSGNSRLNRLHLASLLGELEHRFYIRQQPLQGLYSLLPIQEVSLLSLPDLVHLSRIETLKTASSHTPVAPRLHADEINSGYCLNWEAEDGVYVLECASSADFVDAQMIYQGSQTQFCLAADTVCKEAKSYRVHIRAQHEQDQSLWSNTVERYPLFNNDCAVLSRLEIYLGSTRNGAAEADEFNLHWVFKAPQDLSSVTFQLQESAQEDFSRVLRSFEIALAEPAIQILSIDPHSTRYFRINATFEDEDSLWSNKVKLVSIPVDELDEEQLSDDKPEQPILSVHRAMATFCAARQDMMAILTLPSYNRERTLLHISALSPVHSGNTVLANNAPLPFSMGEARALDYAAVFHPWLADLRQAESDQDSLPNSTPFIPCDGAICGSMASSALHFGAWIAPANTPLADVVALYPELNRDDWQQLSAAHINLLRQDGRGFSLMNAMTLSLSEENSPLNVRRLMILLRRLVLREGNRNVFEPDSIDFRNRIHHYFKQLLARLYVRGAFAGSTQEAAFRVVVDNSVNTRHSSEMGRFIVELRVAPSRPLEFLTIRLTQSGANTVFTEGVSNG